MVLLLLAPFEVLACRCREPTLHAAYARADAVAVVQIKEIAALPDGAAHVTGEVLQSWKADVPRSLNVFTGDNCIYTMEGKEIYLLYLTNGKGGDFGTYRCHGNRRKEEAADSLRWLMRHGKRSEVIPTQPDQ